ncbi:MAG: hypothetical protein CMQ17_12640 [Gammaproteobacteria bacterium]|nr:hypothetical protein [Gammaproteobacteria bacterium]
MQKIRFQDSVALCYRFKLARALPQYDNHDTMPRLVPQFKAQRAIMLDVFISYSRKDIEFAQRLQHDWELETSGQKKPAMMKAKDILSVDASSKLATK